MLRATRFVKSVELALRRREAHSCDRVPLLVVPPFMGAYRRRGPDELGHYKQGGRFLVGSARNGKEKHRRTIAVA